MYKIHTEKSVSDKPSIEHNAEIHMFINHDQGIWEAGCFNCGTNYLIKIDYGI